MTNARTFYGLFSAIAVFLAGCAGFEGDIPVDAVPNTAYISPANQDGIQDSLELNLDMPQIKGMALASYSFVLKNQQGNDIFVQKAEIISNPKVFISQAPLVIPDRIVWDGRLANGSWAPDGEYTYQFVVKSMKDQQGSTPPAMVVVDNMAPRLLVSTPYRLFSPNGDGKIDFLPIYQQQSTVEDLWQASISDVSGSIVKKLTWEGMATDFDWDGLDNQGRIVPNGIYTYRIASTDKAGNGFSETLDGITVDSSVSRIGLVSSSRIFSPNGDGVMDTVSLIPDVERTDGIKDWKLSIVDSRGTVQKNWTGNSSVSSVVFDGKDEWGRQLADGDYYGRLVVGYVNGDAPETSTEKFEVDNKPPTAALSSEYKLFSPDGDGRRDTVTINQSSSVEGKWTSRIVNSAGAVQKSIEWNERLLPFTWDGKDSQGRIVPDGVYSYEVSSRDSAGNPFTGVFQGLTVDTRPTPVTLTSSASGFSPNGDGKADTIQFAPRPTIRDGISSWKFSVSTVDNDSRWETSGLASVVPESISWDGRNASGKVMDGLYNATMVVEYEKGNRTETALDTFVVVDTTAPVVKLNIGPLPFSPDADGFNDVLTLQPEIADVSPIVSWNLDIADSHGTAFYNLRRTGKPVSFTWDGRGSGGDLVLSAEDYSVSMSVVDSYGNRGQFKGIIPVDILVIRDGDKLRISISNIYFKPFTADYQDIEPDLAKKNIETLNRLAEILKKYAAYSIRLEGSCRTNILG